MVRVVYECGYCDCLPEFEKAVATVDSYWIRFCPGSSQVGAGQVSYLGGYLVKLGRFFLANVPST